MLNHFISLHQLIQASEAQIAMDNSLLSDLVSSQRDYGAMDNISDAQRTARTDPQEPPKSTYTNAFLVSLDQIVFVLIYLTYCKDESFTHLLATSLIQILISQFCSPIALLELDSTILSKVNSAKTGLRLYVILLGINNISLHLFDYGLPVWSWSWDLLIDSTPYLTQNWISRGLLTQWVGESSLKSVTLLLILDVLTLTLQLVEVGAIGSLRASQLNQVTVDL